MRLPLVLSPLLLASCAPVSPITFEVCDLELVATPDRGLPGDVVRLDGGPMSTDWRSSARFDGVEAEILSVDRTDCELCDGCRQEAGCLACGTCVACETLCAPCLESAAVVVPDVSPGEVTLAFVNGYGSASLAFRVLGDDDTGATSTTGDTGAPVDTASSDTGDTASAAPPDTSGTGDTGGGAGPAPTGDTSTPAVDTAAAPPTADTAAAPPTADTAASAAPTGDTGPIQADTADTAGAPRATADTAAASTGHTGSPAVDTAP